MRKEYDFSNGVRGVHAASYAEGVEVYIDGEKQLDKVVSLAPDVAAVFPDSDSVNEALRVLIRAAKGVRELPKASYS